MLKSDLKRVISKLEPDQGMKYRLEEKIMQKTQKRWSWKPITAIAAAGFAVVLSIGVLVSNLTPNVKAEPARSVYIPKVELSQDGKTSAKMMGLIVYQGKVYLQSALQVDPAIAQSLLGDKLGTTKSGITEWSKQDDYAVEFASTVGVLPVYTVKGYDKSFRIMTCETIDGVVYAQFYENFNDITVNSGKDLFGKLNLENNVQTIKYENYESWNNGLQQVKPLANLDAFNDFLPALNGSAPYEQDSLPQLWDDQSADSQKFVYLKMKDGSDVQLRLFKDGYVYYNGIGIYFKVEKTAFDKFWNEIV